tara:strand:- start:134 stop:337 length:204 start_codon:yes stop_codon:yes gene_type:complete
MPQELQMVLYLKVQGAVLAVLVVPLVMVAAAEAVFYPAQAVKMEAITQQDLYCQVDLNCVKVDLLVM